MNKKLETEKYIEDIANHLWNPRIYGKVTAMIGAGFSKNAISYNNTSMPDWGELSKMIFDKVHPMPKDRNTKEYQLWKQKRISKTSGNNVLKLAEEYSVIFGHNSLDQLISNAISDKNYAPSKLHEELLKLPWYDIFTTNYDTLLKRTCNLINRNSSQNYKVIHTYKDLPNSIQPRIIKLHGYVTNNGPYIITEEDYRTYPYKYAPFVNTVQQAMIETLLCMIGFSGDDPNFLNWLGWLRDNMSEYCPKLYLCGIFDTLDESEIEVLKSKNVILIDLSCLIKNTDDKKYYNAYMQFFKLINDYNKPLQISYLTWEMNIEKLSEKLRTDNDILNNNIILTNSIAQRIRRFTHKNLSNILRQEKVNLSALYEILYRMKKCYEPIYDNEASQLKNIVQTYTIDDNKLKLLIYLFLCRMYRMDSLFTEYNECIKALENINNLNDNQKYEIILEKSKYYLCIFDYDNGLKELNKIPNSYTNILLLLKKLVYCIYLEIINKPLNY